MIQLRTIDLAEVQIHCAEAWKVLRRPVSLLLFVLLTTLGQVSVSNAAGPPPGLYAAFLTQDGHIRTVVSDNGNVFKTGKFDVIHVESSDFGPGIARDPRSGILALAFFPNDVVGGGTKLVIKLGLGPTRWEEDAAAWMDTETQSPPAIHYLSDGVYAVAWNKGGSIATASFNDQEGLVPSEFESTAALGAPTITSDGDMALMIWQSARQPGVYHSATGSLDGEGGVMWERGSNIAREITLASGSMLNLRGRPSVTWDGTDYWLAATGTMDGGEAWGRTIAFLKSRNGQQDWTVESTCLLDVPESSVPFEWLALAIVDDEVRVLVHRANSPPSWLKLMDDSCEVISQLQNSLLTRMQPSMIWSSVPDPVELPTATPPANALWIEQGPGPIFSGQVEGIQNRPVVGAVQSIAPHPFDPNVVYVGAASGGVWKTENALDANPTWAPLTDNMPSLSIGSVIFNPCDVQGNSLFVGTGDFASGSGIIGGIASRAVGIYQTTDAGDSWQVIGDANSDGITDGLAGTNIRNLVAGQCNATTGQPFLLLGTTGGLFRGVFGGGNWTFTQLSLPGTTTSNVNITTLIADTQNPDIFYAAGPGPSGAPVSVLRSQPGTQGQNWSPLRPPPGIVAGGAVRLAMSPSPNATGVPTLYVAVASGELAFVSRSTNRGTNWISIGTPQIGGRGPFPGGQSARPGHFSLAADPIHANIVYIGGDRQPQALPEGVSASGTVDWSGNLFMGDASKPFNSIWQPLVGLGANRTSPHADSRHITFDAVGNLLEADDGGVYRMRTPTLSGRKWESINGNLRVTQLYSVAWDFHNDVIFGGAQDVGSVEQTATGGPGHISPWRDARLFSFAGQDFVTAEGDGGSVAVDNDSQTDASVRYTMGNNFRLFFRRFYPDPSPPVAAPFNFTYLTFVVPGNPACQPVALPFCGLHPMDQNINGLVVSPIAVNETQSNRLVVGLNAVYESSDQGLTWRWAITPQCFTGSGQNCRITALAYGGTTPTGPNPGLLIAATGNNLTIRQVIGGSLTNRLVGGTLFSNTAANTIRDIALDPADWRTVYLIQQGGQVWRIDDITNSSSAPVNITGNLLVTPTNPGQLTNLRTIEIFREGGEVILMVGGAPINRTAGGTDTGGVMWLRNADQAGRGGVTANWSIFGVGLPNVTATDLHYNEEDDILLVGTWGRGSWTVENASDALR